MRDRFLSLPLGAYIKSRRERLQPHEAGIDPLLGRRRTPGLRREEVSYLANLSVSYYTWLEQGREVNPSVEVLHSISRALKLNRDEKRHLFELAGINPLIADGPTTDVKSELSFLQKMLDQLYYPSIVTNEVSDIVAWNRAAELVVADFSNMPESERYMMNPLYFSDEYRVKLVNWEDLVRCSVAIMRASMDRFKENSLYASRVERLMKESAEFKFFWDLYEIKQKQVVNAFFRTESGHDLAFELHSAQVIDNIPGLHWCFFIPIDGSGTEEILRGITDQKRL